MALTLDVEQRLGRASLIAFYDANPQIWLDAATEAYAYLAGKFPTIRADDVAKVLHPIIEVNVALRTRLSEKKLTQKYWTKDFVDLIIDRTWLQIQGG